MFALIACIVFAVGLFGGHLGSLNLLYLGLAFLALHLAANYPIIPTWIRRSPQ